MFNVDNLTHTDKYVLHTQTFQCMFTYRSRGNALIKHWAFLLIGFPALLWLTHIIPHLAIITPFKGTYIVMGIAELSLVQNCQRHLRFSWA